MISSASEDEWEEESPIPIPLERVPEPVAEPVSEQDQSTVQLSLDGVEMKMTVSRTGRCSTRYEGLEVELY